ncbi:MAG: hypothetical protein ABSB82_10475 [Terriglobia bacterium]|jgi:hypothetical protein
MKRLLEILHQVLSTLDKLDIPYAVVGSFASSTYTRARQTQDVDLLVKMKREQVDGFVEAFSRDFFVDRGLTDQALTRGTSFNIIHFQTTFKLDFFVCGNRYNETVLSRRLLKKLDPETGLSGYIQTPEDTVLSKLDWFRKGGEISENQWDDVIGILETQAARLDTSYLQKWAAELGLSDLLERARAEARTS